MDSEGMSFPLIHEHLMLPWNDLRKGGCCGRLEPDSDGYYCKSCDFFVHKKCGESSESIQHPSHSIHTLQLHLQGDSRHTCDICGKDVVNLFYRCEICNFDVDLHCARYPPPKVIDISEMHPHKLTFVKERVEFDCDAECGKIGDGYLYKCHDCDSTFHLDCVWHPSELKHQLEVNHSHHSLHPLKLLTGHPPEYSDGKCRLCGRKIDDELFYHCSLCNFTLDMRCVLHPPPQSLMDVKAHDHQLTLLSRLMYFTCNVCGLNGDRSPYVCLPCGFMIHIECLALPRIININRHDHRVSRTSLLGGVNSVCGVCRKKVDWTCGGFTCQRCPGYVVHSKCATRKDVWNQKELEEVPEEEEDTEPYVVIDNNTIQHFSHKEHYLRLHINDVVCEENKRCSACTRPICLQSFYGCMVCNFTLHHICAQLPTRKWHVLHNERLTLVASKLNFFWCHGCLQLSNGFMYIHGYVKLDVRCCSISEPLVHPSHHHSLYYISQNKDEKCTGCSKWRTYLLRCIEDGCRFDLCFECAILPEMVKHRVDDHPLSLCYGEKASGKCWCDICEKETNPNTWFYTCKNNQASLHTKCVLGDLVGFMPRSTVEFLDILYEVVLNNSVSRPFCRKCKSRCMYSMTLKMLGTSDTYFCSFVCLYHKRAEEPGPLVSRENLVFVLLSNPLEIPSEV